MKKQAFTLVELIVVVTILAILATIGFVSYSGYLTGVRDTNRVASLTAISDGLELYRTKNDLPLPDNNVEVQVESETIARQGYAGSNVLQTIEYSKAGKDPKDDQYYSYYLTDDKKHYQMMAFLEESDNLETNIITQTNAATDYSNRHPKVYGKRLGILTDLDNTPIQEIGTIKTAGNLNMTGGTVEEYIGRLNDVEMLSGSGRNILIGTMRQIVGKSNKSCKEIIDTSPISNGVDGLYKLKIGTELQSFYCDMTTNSGGWTRISSEIKDIEEVFAWELSDPDTKDLTGNNRYGESDGEYPRYLLSLDASNTYFGQTIKERSLHSFMNFKYGNTITYSEYRDGPVESLYRKVLYKDTHSGLMKIRSESGAGNLRMVNTQYFYVR